MSTTCRSCDAEVLWLVHEGTRKRAPIDARPVEGGNVLPNVDEGTYVTIGLPEERAAYPGQLHTNHFQTCPQAAAWKGRTRAGRS